MFYRNLRVNMLENNINVSIGGMLVIHDLFVDLGTTGDIGLFACDTNMTISSLLISDTNYPDVITNNPTSFPTTRTTNHPSVTPSISPSVFLRSE